MARKFTPSKEALERASNRIPPKRSPEYLRNQAVYKAAEAKKKKDKADETRKKLEQIAARALLPRHKDCPLLGRSGQKWVKLGLTKCFDCQKKCRVLLEKHIPPEDKVKTCDTTRLCTCCRDGRFLVVSTCRKCKF